jgi:hypothetical protein
MFDALAAPNTFENRWLLLKPVGRYEDRDRLADDLFGEVAENPLCTLVPACDDAIKVFAYDCVITGLDDGCEPAGLLLTFAQRSFGEGAFNEVRCLSRQHI